MAVADTVAEEASADTVVDLEAAAVPVSLGAGRD
jgi:hypothetical protein